MLINNIFLFTSALQQKLCDEKVAIAILTVLHHKNIGNFSADIKLDALELLCFICSADEESISHYRHLFHSGKAIDSMQRMQKSSYYTRMLQDEP